ncbi:class I SAM-dependent methyltransferase [Streptomyces sp. NPDC050560]|uniref:class I SAM-dependent methyltransferase n=1 Tax=Streptomyces sp. NPDC050560 TaxID=3365630 RepID=UPI0037961450
MFAPHGPTLRELAVQALSSVERGYDLLAPKFDATPFRTPAPVLDAVTAQLRRRGPYRTGLDLCCGTGAGLGVLDAVCGELVTGVDVSTGMLRQARAAAAAARTPAHLVRGDALALPYRQAFDLVVSFGAFGHFLPRERPALFAAVLRVLRPGGSLAFPLPASPRPGTPADLALLGFDTAMRLRNALWRPPFVMYYRTFRPVRIRRELVRAGFEVDIRPLTALGTRADGRPRCGLVVATRPGPR